MVEKMIINALQDPIWKVRAAALTALSAFGTQMSDKGLPILMRMFREGQQNRQLVSETIISMGPKGEQQLIALIKQNQSESKLINNSKAKECILRSFALSNINNPNIDFVIETLFYEYARE